ncbi:MAG: glycosyltransferase family 39 protein [Thermodesulfobacteriota bacterium]
MTSERPTPLAWAASLLVCAALFLAPPWLDRQAVFLWMCGAFGASLALTAVPRQGAARAGRTLAVWLGAACLALAASGLFARVADRAAYFAVCGLRSEFISEIMEGREIVKAWALTQGQGIYTGLDGYPLFVTLYGPFYYVLAAVSSVMSGPGVHSARLVSVVSGIALGAVAGGVVFRLTGSVLAAMACAAMTLTTPTMGYAAHARPDVLVWLTLFAGLYCLLGAMKTPRRMGASFWGAAAFFILAAFSKQQTWVFIAAALGWCLWDANLRPLGTRLAVVMAAGCALALAGMQWATGGEYLRQTFLFPKRMSALSSYNSFASAWERFREFLMSHWGLTAVFAASLATRRRRLGLMEVMFLAGLGSMVMVMRWWGSSVNHFLSLALFMLIGSCTLLAALFRERRYGWAALCLALIAPPAFSFSIPSGPDPCGTAAEREAAQALESRLEKIAGPVIMDAEGAYVFLGKPLFSRLRLYDAWETDFFDKTGLWSLPDSVLARDIRERGAAAFVDSQVFMSSDLAGLVRSYYRVDFKAGRYTVYTPRQASAILAYAGPRHPCPGGGCMEAAGVEGLKDWGDYLQPTGAEGALVLKAPASVPGGGSRLVYYPRFTAPGQEIRVLVPGDGAGWIVADRLAYEGPPPGTGFENRREVALPVYGEGFLIRFELSGAAQLWMTSRQPLMAYFGEPHLTR